MSKKSKIILLIGTIILIIMTCTSHKKLESINGNDNFSNAEIQTGHIDIAIMENGKNLSDEIYEGDGVTKFESMEFTKGDFEVGKKYDANIGVLNDEMSIDVYTRARIYKTWSTLEGEKVTEVNPELIEIGFEDSLWIEDTNNSTSELTILYYPQILRSGEEIPLMYWVKVNNEVFNEANITSETNNGYTTYTMSYPSNNLILNIEVNVEAVQTHSAVDAIKSAWGIDVIVNGDGSLSFP